MPQPTDVQPSIQLRENGPACISQPVTLRFNADEAQRLADLSKALGHPVRVQMVDILNRSAGAVCACDFERHFDLTQPTISHHLKKLREAGLVHTEQRGPRTQRRESLHRPWEVGIDTSAQTSKSVREYMGHTHWTVRTMMETIMAEGYGGSKSA